MGNNRRISVSEEEQMKIMLKLKQERAEKCLKEMNQLLEKYNCAIDMEFLFNPQSGLQRNWIVLPK